MPDRPPWLDYQAPQGVTVPLGPRDPYKDAAEARAADAARRSAAEWNASHNPDGTPKVQAPSLLGDPNLTGPEYLKSLPQNIRNRVQQLIDGRSILTAREKGTPLGQQLMDAANQADPTFDENVSHARYVARTQFTGMGKGSQLVQAADRLAQHVNDLYAASKELPGPDLGFSPFSNLATGVSNKFHQKELAKYNATLPLIAGELQKLTKNGAATEGESQHIMHNLGPGQPQDVRQEAIKEIVQLGRAQFQPLRDAWNSAWQGSTPPPMPMDFHPATNAIFDTIEEGGEPIKRDKKGELILPGQSGSNDAPPVIGSGPKGPGGGGSPPPTGPGGTPRADYTGMVGGPNQGVATGAYRNVYDPVMASALSAFIKRGTDYGTAAAYAQSHGFNPPAPKDYAAAVAFQKQHPNAQPNVQADRSVPTTLGERLSASPLAAGIVAAGRGATAGLDDVVGRQLAGDQYDANSAALSATNPKADLAGNVLGGALGMYYGGGVASKALGRYAPNVAKFFAANPVKAAAAGDALYGGTYGAAENPDNPLLGAGVGLVTAPVASVAGQGATKAIGAGLRGVTNPAVQRLQAAGIPLTVGEVLGGGWKKAQDAMTSLYGPGNMVGRRYAEGRRALNEAAFNQAGNIVDTPINAVGQQGIEALNTAKSQAYSGALDPIQLNLNDPQFINSMEGALKAADAIPGAELPEGYGGVSIRHAVANQVAPDGTMTGKGFQSAYRGLSQTASKAAPKIEGYDIGQAVGKAKDALTTALQEQNPGAFEGFQRANAANRYLNVLADAVNTAKNQISDGSEVLFTPAQLNNAATASAKKYGGKISAASGAKPFNQLVNDAQQVMSSKLPESGTVPRWLVTSAATGGLSGASGALGYGANGGEGAAEGAAIPLIALSALGTRRGQQLLTAALLKRAAPYRIAGQALVDNPQVGGNLLTATTFPFLANR